MDIRKFYGATLAALLAAAVAAPASAQTRVTGDSKILLDANRPK